MSPNDTKKRREAVLDKGVKTLQSSVTDHFKPKNEAKKSIVYSDHDEAFANAAIEWLVAEGLVNIFLISLMNVGLIFWNYSSHRKNLCGHPSRG